MAIRPVFTVSLDKQYCIKKEINFEFFSGFSDKQKKKSINSLHQSYLKIFPHSKILEISSNSESELGIKLSAFNLMITSKSGKCFSVESAFQASKVFEKGGPYKDLLDVTSREAKRDERIKNSGKLKAFAIYDNIFPTEPKTYFYNWLYINTLSFYPSLTEELMSFDAFSDIAFNPNRSINCQAEAAAIYVSLHKQHLLSDALKNKECFLEIVYPNQSNNIQNRQDCEQLNLF